MYEDLVDTLMVSFLGEEFREEADIPMTISKHKQMRNIFKLDDDSLFEAAS